MLKLIRIWNINILYSLPYQSLPIFLHYWLIRLIDKQGFLAAAQSADILQTTIEPSSIILITHMDTLSCHRKS